MRTFVPSLALLLLAGCSVEQTQPAPVAPDERWGHLPPDPERPQQAERSSGTADPAAASRG